eukprot:237095-Rhodomonas_salina.1
MATDGSDGAWHSCAPEVAGMLGVDCHVYGYSDVDPEMLRSIHMRTVLGIKLGIIDLEDKHINIAFEAKDTDIVVTMMYARKKFVCPSKVVYLPAFPKADGDIDEMGSVFTDVDINSTAGAASGSPATPSTPGKKRKNNSEGEELHQPTHQWPRERGFLRCSRRTVMESTVPAFSMEEECSSDCSSSSSSSSTSSCSSASSSLRVNRRRRAEERRKRGLMMFATFQYLLAACAFSLTGTPGHVTRSYHRQRARFDRLIGGMTEALFVLCFRMKLPVMQLLFTLIADDITRNIPQAVCSSGAPIYPAL